MTSPPTPSEPVKAAEKTDTVVKDVVRPAITLPEETMFVGSFNFSANKYNIFLLDAATGDLITTYEYAASGRSNFCKPFIANGVLYSVRRDKIDAITINTGNILWTSNVPTKSDAVSITLHNDRFYGVAYNRDGTIGNDFVYALDATKSSNDFIWKTQLVIAGTLGNLPVRYFNGLIYVLHGDGTRLDTFDAKTGAPKWSISNKAATYSLALLDKGLVINGLFIIDAATGVQTNIVKEPAIPLIAAGATQMPPVVECLSDNLYFVKTTQTVTSVFKQTYLSAIDRATGTEKWRTDFGSVTGDYLNNTTITKAVKLSWNNKLIIEKSISVRTGPLSQLGTLVLQSFTNKLSLLDMNTGLETDIAGGESSKAVGTIVGFAQNDHDANFVTNNVIYGNYATVTGSKTLAYATDLLTGQQKWLSKPLAIDGGNYIYSCVFVKSSNQVYSPYFKTQ